MEFECSNFHWCWNYIKIDKFDMELEYFCKKCIDRCNELNSIRYRNIIFDNTPSGSKYYKEYKLNNNK